LRKFTLVLKITTIFLLFLQVGFGQKVLNAGGADNHDDHAGAKNGNHKAHKCHTMEVLEARFSENPALRAKFEEEQASFAKNVEAFASSRRRAGALNITIPVVVHVVLPDPNAVTISQIERQLQRLTIDFLGDNPDSTNLNSAWQSIRGRSGIKFVLAKRDPNGGCTDGVTRTVTTSAPFPTSPTASSKNIKRTAQGGKDGWDYTKYLNMWVGDIEGGVLGFATFPTLTSYPAADQGVVVGAPYFGEAATACGVADTYGLGRTLTHEVGHYFNLFHTFQGGCNGTGDGVADTPPVSAPFYGCATGVISSTLCTGSPNPPGVMYQNYMDYSDDACLTMFTVGQVTRMETAITTLPERTGYATTDKATPLGANDAAWYRYTGTSNCSLLTGCTTATVMPAASIKNNGSANITSATILVKVNNTTVQTLNWSGTILPDSIKMVTGFNPISFSTTGLNNVSLEITNVNGGTDACTNTNTITIPYTVSLLPLAQFPLSENFETGSFPATGWSLVQSTTDAITWERTNITGPNCSTRSALLNHYDYETTGRSDDLRTPRINVAGQSSVNITFDVAHKPYANPVSFDRLRVLVSTDCGATFTTVYDKSGSTLATGAATNARFIPTTSEWRTETIAVPASLLTAGEILVAFRTTNDFGNNIYIDNISVASGVTSVARDVSISAIVSPTTTQCSKTIAPFVRVANMGTEAVTAFTVGYKINSGATISQNFNVSIPVGGNTVVLLPPTSVGVVNGNNELLAFTSNPVTVSGTGDQRPSNDQSCGLFSVRNVMEGPIANGFELPNWPTPGATSANYPEYSVASSGPTTQESFIRRMPGFNSEYSIFIDNYDINRTNQLDAIFFPAINTTNASAVKFEFDVAHKNYPGALDSLILQYSTNCGATYVNSSFAFAGASLATAGSSTAPFIPASVSDWRRRTVTVNGTALAGSSLIFRFLHKGRFGNNIFIDNINVVKVFGRDLKMNEIVMPKQTICTPSSPVSIMVTNNGTDTITGFKAAFTINGGAPIIKTITGISLYPNVTGTYALNDLSVPATTNNFDLKVYTYDVVSNSGTGDQLTNNDSLGYKVFVTQSITASPFEEKFEGTSFPPTSWGVNNADFRTTWSKAAIGYNSNGSAVLTNRTYANARANGTKDELLTPNVVFGGPNTIIDSLFLKFDLAAATFNYPGATQVTMDTLEILYSLDCGATTTSLYKKWGEDLQTINDPNSTSLTEFIPLSVGNWRTEKVDITALRGLGNAQFIFRNASNNGNNIYLDNISIYKVAYPEKLRFNRFIVTPSIGNGNYTIRHKAPPTNLRGIEVFNAQGQLVYRRQYNGEASNAINIDLTNLNAGIYEIRMHYTDKKYTERIVKQ
jgi:hypothetical protein